MHTEPVVNEISAGMIPPIDGEIRLLRLEELHESPWNPRQYYPEKQLEELAESMRQSGFRQWLPIMTRPREEGGYEIGAGHRRSRAARMAGIELVPAIVRPMSDVEFLDVLNFDNCGREDVHPLHEAAGWQAWMQKTGSGVADIAARIGQSKEYVYQRLKYASLIEPARKAFLDGEITAGHAILIARIPQASDQKKALNFCEPPTWNKDQRPGVRQLAEFIGRDIHLDLGGAAFDLKNPSLVAGAGPCSTCAKRTSNSPELFSDRENGGDECTDPGCFNMKLTNHVIQIKADLKSQEIEPVEVSSFYTVPKKKGVLSKSQYSVEDKAKGATAAIVIDGRDAGKVIHIKVYRNANSTESSSSSSPAVDSERRKQEEEDRNAKIQKERAIRLQVLNAVREKIVGPPSLLDLQALVTRFLLDAELLVGVIEIASFHGVKINTDDGADDYDTAEKLLDLVPKMAELELSRFAIELTIIADLNRYAISRNEAPLKLDALAKRYKVDVQKIRASFEKGPQKDPSRAKTSPATQPARPAVKPAPPKKTYSPVAKKKPTPVKPAPKKPAKPATNKAVSRPAKGRKN